MLYKRRAKYSQYVPYVVAAAKGAFKAAKVYRQTKMGESSSSRMEIAQNDAQPNIGYGQHDAKTFVSRRKRSGSGKSKKRRRNSKKINKALNKRQKKLVRKIVKRNGIPVSFKDNCHQVRCMKSLDSGGAVSTQATAVFVENTGWTGFNDQEDKGNHFNDIFNAVFLNTDMSGSKQQKAEQFEKLKLRVKSSKTVYNIVCSASCPPATVEAHYFVAKKSITAESLMGNEAGGLGEVFANPLTKCQDLVATAFDAKLLNRDAGPYIQNYSTYPGWDPRYDSALIKDYFTWEKTERYNVSANANIVIDNDHKLGLTLNARTVTKYAFLKNISRIVVFTGLGVAYCDAEGHGQEAQAIPSMGNQTFGMFVKMEHRINWRPVYDTPDQVTSGAVKLSAMTHRGGVIPIGTNSSDNQLQVT